MNKKDRVRQIMQLKDEVVNYDRHVNGCYIHGDNFSHYLVKAAVFKVLSDAGHEVVTEAEFADGTIADVLDADTGIVYEVQQDMSVDKAGNYADKDVVKDVIVLDLQDACNAANGPHFGSGELRKYVEREVVI